jgi:hypothetical protein
MAHILRHARARTPLRWQSCIVLACLVGLSAGSLVANAYFPQQRENGQPSHFKIQQPLKDQIADGTRDAILWLLSGPMFPGIIFLVSASIAIYFWVMALKTESRFLGERYPLQAAQ